MSPANDNELDVIDMLAARVKALYSKKAVTIWPLRPTTHPIEGPPSPNPRRR
jgi:hypothetical protein